MKEACVTINGTMLSGPLASTLRVACTHMLSEMTDPDCLGTDEHGRAMVAIYKNHLREILGLILDQTGRAQA